MFSTFVTLKILLIFFRSKNPKCTIQIPEDELLKLDDFTGQTDGQTDRHQKGTLQTLIFWCKKNILAVKKSQGKLGSGIPGETGGPQGKQRGVSGTQYSLRFPTLVRCHRIQ